LVFDREECAGRVDPAVALVKVTEMETKRAAVSSLYGPAASPLGAGAYTVPFHRVTGADVDAKLSVQGRLIVDEPISV
jgi:hypothetical protein